MEKELLLNYLKLKHTGQQNAVSNTALEAIFHIHGRAIRDAVNSLRCDSHPICSGDEGYYYAANSTELTTTIKQLSSRITKIAGAKTVLTVLQSSIRIMGSYRSHFNKPVPKEVVVLTVLCHG